MGSVASPRNILIIKPSSLGDIVHALPVLAALREAHPAARISWLVGTSFTSLLAGHPMLDEVIPFDRARFGRMWRSPVIFVEFWRFVWSLRRRRFDLVIDLQGLIRSGLMSYLSGARLRVGFADAREGAWLFYNRRVRCQPKALHAVEKLLGVAAALGLSASPPRFPLALTDDERLSAERLLTSGGVGSGRFTAVLPGARWRSKMWPAENFSRLIDELHRGGRPRCVLLGAPNETEIAAGIAAGCATGVANLVGRTSLRELAALLERASQVICLDSGPMHIAAALGTPTVALFGPTDPARTGPYSAAAKVLTNEVECRPCLKRECPLVHQHCLTRLSVENVLAALPPHANPARETTAGASQ